MLSFNKRAYQIHVALLVILSSAFPVSLIYYFDRVGYARLSIITSISFLFGYIIFRFYIYPNFVDAQKLSLPIVDGTITGSHQVGFGKSRRFQASITVNLDGNKTTFYSKKSGRSISYKTGSSIQILFNSQKPEDSILISENPYIIQKD